MTPSTIRTLRRQLSTIQLMLSVTARATRQMPRTVKKMTDRRRPLIMSSIRIARLTRLPSTGKRRHFRDLEVAHDAASAFRSLRVIQLMSNSYQARPWRAETGCA